MEDNQDSNELHLIVCRDKWVINTHKFSLPSYFIIRENGSENGENDQGGIFYSERTRNPSPPYIKIWFLLGRGRSFWEDSWQDFLEIFSLRSKFPARTSQSPDKSPRGQEQKRESPKQVPTRESPVKRDRMSPSAAPMSLQQDRKPPDSRREETTVIPTQRENGLMSTGRSQSSSYEPPAGLKHCYSFLALSFPVKYFHFVNLTTKKSLD